MKEAAMVYGSVSEWDNRIDEIKYFVKKSMGVPDNALVVIENSLIFSPRFSIFWFDNEVAASSEDFDNTAVETHRWGDIK